MCRVLHMVCILLVWSLAHYIIYIHAENESFNIVQFFSKLYDSNWNYSYWYLYAYIGFLLSLPLLQRLAQNLANREYVYLTILFVIFYMIVPVMQYLLWQGNHNLNGNLYPGWIGSSIVIYPLMGYFLQHRIKDFWNKRRIVVLWLVNIGTILVSCYLTYFRAQITGVCDEANSQAFHSTFVLINCVAIFVTCQYINNNITILQKIQRPVVSMGGCTFGIYLLHLIIEDKTPLTDYLWNLLREQMHMPPMTYAFVYCAIIFACGYVITLVMKKIPVLKRMVS